MSYRQNICTVVQYHKHLLSYDSIPKHIPQLNRKWLYQYRIYFKKILYETRLVVLLDTLNAVWIIASPALLKVCTATLNGI